MNGRVLPLVPVLVQAHALALAAPPVLQLPLVKPEQQAAPLIPVQSVQDVPQAKFWLQVWQVALVALPGIAAS